MELDQNSSRFFIENDESTSHFFFPLPSVWPSRPFEYPWASKFVQPDDVVLDAACGLSHPFKFFLADNCRMVYAIDNDNAITSPDLIKKAITDDFGHDAELLINDQYFERIKFHKGDITNLPFNDGTFDKIFCISVLEHLNDRCNSNQLLAQIPGLYVIFHSDIRKTLKEFKRVLKPDGQIILTFDYPIINLKYFSHLLSKIGLEFIGDYNPNLPIDAVYSNKLNLYFFRACLKRKNYE